MKNFVRVLLAAVVLVTLTTAPVLAKTSWNANSNWPPKNLHSVGLTDFAEKVKKATNGDLDIVVNPGASLGFKGPDLLKAVRDGLVPLSDMLIGGVAGDEQVFDLVMLPFLARNYDELRILLDIAYPYFDKKAQKWGQKILYIAPWPGQGFWTKKKIVSVGDLKGLKMRTSNRSDALVVEAVGGTALALPFTEVYTSLQTGLIDSVITSTPTSVDGKFWEVLKYYTPAFISCGTNMVNVNLKAFNKLPKAQRDALVTIGKETHETMWKNVKVWDKESEAISNKNGIEALKPSDKFIADMEKITEGIRADWMKKSSEDSKNIYSEFMKKVKR